MAFDKLKQLQTNAPVLAYFDPTKPIMVQADSSQSSLGGVLLCDGRPVEYTSRALSEAEKHYAQIEKETLAIVHCMERFHT